MALFPPVDSAVAPTKLVPSSHLGHQKNNFQHEHTSKKEESLKDLCAQKSQSFSSSSYSAERSQHGSRYGGAFSAELQSKYPTSQTKTLPPKLVAKRKEGVDRAHPLKPIVHHNGVDVPVVNRAQDRSFPYREEASNIRPSSWNRGKTPGFPYMEEALNTRPSSWNRGKTPGFPYMEEDPNTRPSSWNRGKTPGFPYMEEVPNTRPSSRNRGKTPGFPYMEEAPNTRPSSWNRGKTPGFPYMEEAPNTRPSSRNRENSPGAWAQLDAALSQWMAEPASHLYRRDLAYILKLEADGRILEEEIRKKEILLLEKLRRAEEELRRIQRERALQEAEERRDREAERTHEQKAARHLEEKACRTAVKPGDRVFGGVQSAEATIPKAGTTLHPRELAMGELKKVASNSKIQDRIPVERLTSYSEVPRKASPSPPALPDRDSNAHSPMQTASAMEQGGLGQCSFCGRKFLCTRLEKHMSVCDKRQGSKRKVFDSKRARARGTELEQFQQRSRTERPQSKAPRKNNWRQKHEALLQILHQAQELQKVSSKGGKLSDLPPLPPTENPAYVPCPYCGRRFAPNSAERHIPKCKNIKSRPPPPPHLRRC